MLFTVICMIIANVLIDLIEKCYTSPFKSMITIDDEAKT